MSDVSGYKDIREVAYDIFNNLKTKNKLCIMPIFAFNGTGKTRLSVELENVIGKGFRSDFLEICKELQDNNIDRDEKIKLQQKFKEIGKYMPKEEKQDIIKNYNNPDFNIEIEENIPRKVLCFNAFFVDIFIWDNEENILKFDKNHYLMELINTEGLEHEIIEDFVNFFGNNEIKIEPSFDFEKGEVSFILASGDDKSVSNIKISKGEESVFIWTVFFVIIKAVFNIYLDEKVNISQEDQGKNRWKIFEKLEYIVIDDPVSSVDDAKIIDIAVNLIDVISKDYKKEYIDKKIEYLRKDENLTDYYIKTEKEDMNKRIQDLNLKFIITTQHALFYNICFNSVKVGEKDNCKKMFKSNGEYFLEKQGDTPFSYHVHAKNIIQKAIDEKMLQRYHFNLFRALLEKTANFLGYSKWEDCLMSDDKKIFRKILNNYSHGRFSELEVNSIPEDDKTRFINEFYNFINKFNFKK